MKEVKLGKVIKYISTNLEKRANNLLKEEDLSLSQGLLLIWLDDTKEKELPIKEIEKKFGSAQSTTYGIVNRLENKGFIETYSINSKIKIVKLCDAGSKKIEFIKDSILLSEKDFFTGFTDDEKNMFIELLIKAENNF